MHCCNEITQVLTCKLCPIIITMDFLSQCRCSWHGGSSVTDLDNESMTIETDTDLWGLLAVGHLVNTPTTYFEPLVRGIRLDLLVDSVVGPFHLFVEYPRRYGDLTQMKPARTKPKIALLPTMYIVQQTSRRQTVFPFFFLTWPSVAASPFSPVSDPSNTW